MVGAEPMLEAGAEQLVGGDAVDRVLVREQARCERPSNHERDHRERERDGRRYPEGCQPAGGRYA